MDSEFLKLHTLSIKICKYCNHLKKALPLSESINCLASMRECYYLTSVLSAQLLSLPPTSHILQQKKDLGAYLFTKMNQLILQNKGCAQVY